MPRPNALIPAKAVPVVLTTTANAIVPSCSAIRLSVATPGSIMVRYGSGGVDIELNYPAAGVYIEPGAITQAWLPGAGAAVLDPADTVIFLN